MQSDRMVSHNPVSKALAKVIDTVKARINQAGDKSYVTVVQQLQLVDELAQFELGQFLLQHEGLNGYWTHYLLTYPFNKEKKSITQLERFLLEKSPSILATQQRFQVFLDQNQNMVKNGTKLACVLWGLHVNGI